MIFELTLVTSNPSSNVCKTFLHRRDPLSLRPSFVSWKIEKKTFNCDHNRMFAKEISILRFNSQLDSIKKKMRNSKLNYEKFLKDRISNAVISMLSIF